MDNQSMRILYVLKQTSDLYNKHMARTAEKCGISKQEADVLLFLSNNPHYDTAKDMVERRGFSKGFVSKAVEMLSDRNLISISVSREDRRYQHIVINDNARTVVETLQQSQKSFFKAVSDGISKEEVDAFISLTEKFASNLMKFGDS